MVTYYWAHIWLTLAQLQKVYDLVVSMLKILHRNTQMNTHRVCTILSGAQLPLQLPGQEKKRQSVTDSFA